MATYEEEYNDGFQPPKKDNTLKIVTLIVVGVLTFIVVGFVVLAAVLLPTLSKTRESARQVSCKANLKQIGMALLMYSDDNDSYFPKDLETLITEEYITTGKVFVCPSTEQMYSGDPSVSYTYIPGLRYVFIKPAETIIVYEKDSNHPNWVNVLFADGHVEGNTAGYFDNQIEDSKEIARKLIEER